MTSLPGMYMHEQLAPPYGAAPSYNLFRGAPNRVLESRSEMLGGDAVLSQSKKMRFLT